MLNKPLRMGALNARRIFKASHPNIQKEFCSFLPNHLLSLDILCLQEVSCFQQHDHLSEDYIHQFNNFLFPNTTSVVSKHTAIVCLNRNFYLDDTAISMNERCVVASVKYVHRNLVFPYPINKTISRNVYRHRIVKQDVIDGLKELNSNSPDANSVYTVTGKCACYRVRNLIEEIFDGLPPL
ncbi:hypothetical protein BDF21DRAFT_393840 [Thamnidium elegans]|nr:hypothetical protein BDF21DRAFT_393840 [Thamnidium elegans]